MKFSEKLDAFNKKHHYKNIEAGGCIFRFVLTGNPEGRDLVFLHGGMNMSEMWMDYVDELAGDYRVLIFDFPKEAEGCEELASAIHALFEKLGIKKPILIGASFGGLLAEVIARRYENETAGLILFSTGGLDSDTLKSLKRKFFITPLLLWYMKRCNYEKLKPKMIKAGAENAKDESPEDREYVREMFECMFRTYTREKDLHATGLLWSLAKIEPVTKDDFSYLEGKVLMILPQKDFFSPKMQENLIALMPDPDVRYIDGGHVKTMLRPDIYIKAIREFAEKL